jgi:two-component system, sensor histidine kinase
MVKARKAGRIGPEGLFATLAEPRLAFFRQALLQSPLRVSLVFAAGMIGLTVFLALAEVRAENNGAVSDLLPSEAVFAILMGMAVYPKRLLFVPLVTYVVAFSLAFLLRLNFEVGYLPPGTGAVQVMVWAMVLNAVPAVLAGLAGLYALKRLGNGTGRDDLILSLVTTGAYLTLACLAVVIVQKTILDPSWDGAAGDGLTVVEAGLFRAARIAICGAVLTLLMLDRPTRRTMTVALSVLPAFVVLGILRQLGISIHPTLDVELLALAVALLAPVSAATVTNVVGVVAYVAITGEFLVQIPVTSPDVLRLEVVSVLLLALIYLLVLQRHQAMFRRLESRQTIERLALVHGLATIGYFVVDLETGEVLVDDVAAAMMGVPSRFVVETLLVRTAPAGRDGIAELIAERNLPARTVAFSLATGAVWDEAGPQKYLSAHAYYERRAGGQILAYGAVIDLTADHAREEALAEALARLSEQQDRQTQMFSIVSHELRTPASVISMLVEELEGGARWAEMGPRLRAVSEQLLSVLADMRQAVRPQENLPVHEEAFRPKDLAETVRNTFALMAGGKGIEIDLSLGPEAGAMRVSDRVRLMQALSNLVKNAILHGDCHRVMLAYREEMDETGRVIALWRVSDDGKGIPEAAQDGLFSPFRRGDGARTAKVDGSGLGLYVTKTSIELLGGTVTYTPRAAGGSVFLLRLPVGVEAMAVAAEPAVAEAVVPKQDWRGRKVMIVEDSDLIGELLTARLKRVFGTVEWVRTGVEALAMFDTMAPDVVLTDLFMPEMGGDDLTSTLRAQGAQCLIIGMTAAAIGDERTRFEQAGTDRVLTKPVSTNQLLEVLEELVRKRAA